MNHYIIVPSISFQDLEKVQMNLAVLDVEYCVFVKPKENEVFRAMFIIDEKHMKTLDYKLPVTIRGSRATGAEVESGYSMPILSDPIPTLAKKFFGISI